MPTENDFRRLMREHLRATKVPKFGQFEFSLLNKVPTGGTGEFPDNHFVKDEPALFLFRIVPTVVGDFTIAGTDFVSELSTTPPGKTPSFAAMKFVQGPNDDSAFGATQTPAVPGPFEGQLVLSDLSTDPAVPPADLDATINFEVTFETFPFDFQQLIMSVSNDGFNANGFAINEIYWNVSDKVEALVGFTPIGTSGWEFVSNV